MRYRSVVKAVDVIAFAFLLVDTNGLALILVLAHPNDPQMMN